MLSVVKTSQKLRKRVLDLSFMKKQTSREFEFTESRNPKLTNMCFIAVDESKLENV